MSVWTNPNHRADSLWSIIRRYPKDGCTELPEELLFAADATFENPGAGIEQYKGRKYCDYFRERKIAWRKFVAKAQENRRIKLRDQTKFQATIKHLKPNYAGLKAVYWATAKVWEERWRFKDKNDLENKLKFIKELYELNIYASRVPIKKSFKDYETIEARINHNKKLQYLMNAKENVDSFWVMGRLRSNMRRVYKDVNGTEPYPYVRLPSTFGKLEVTNFPGGYILHDKKTNESGIFFWKDHDRLVTTINAIANLMLYFVTYDLDSHIVSQRMTEGYTKIMDDMAKAMKKLSWDDCNSLCRAYDVASNLFIAQLSDDINDRSMKDQEAKIVRENLGRLIDVHSVINTAINYGEGITEALELLKVYKLLPCPDFCHYSVVQNIRDKKADQNPFDLNKTITIEDVVENETEIELSLQDFERYMKRMKIFTFKNRHGRFPGKLKDPMNAPAELTGYPHVPERYISMDNVDHIDLVGSFQYKAYDTIEYELVKDKKTSRAWDDMYGTKFAENQVLQFLFDPNFMPQKDIRSAFQHKSYPWKKNISIALKPESKKPSSRSFFMLPDPARRALSEFEANVAQYVEHKSGSSQGKGDSDLSRKFTDIIQWEQLGYTKVLLSFDLEKFSPCQARDFKYTSLKSWAEVFDEPWLLNLMSIFDEYNLKWNKLDYTDAEQMWGNDLEGFTGRMNTDMHLDVMGYAIYKCRKAGLIDDAAKMECLIDDGLLAIMVPDAVFEVVIPEILKIIEAVYVAVGLKISWDKTYTSSFVCQFLNRIFVDGQEVTGGAKAFLRIGKLNPAPIPTIIDHLEAHAATTRGAIKSGTDHRIALFKYLWEVTQTCIRWSGYSKDLILSNELAATMYMPVGLGGFGLSSLFSLSTNQTFDPFNSGIGNMEFLAKCRPDLAPFYNDRINAKMRPMECSSIVRAPRSIRTTNRCLNLRRFANRAKDIIISKSVNPYVLSVAEAMKKSADSPICEVVCKQNVIHDVIRSKMWEMDPSNALEKVVGKLQTSSTAANIIGRKMRVALELINRREGTQLLIESCKGILVSRA